MKTFLILAIFLLSYFEGIAGQEDYDRRLEAFVQESLVGFPNWLKENGFVPFPLPGAANFTLTGTNEANGPGYNVTGQFSNLYYHGAEKNMRALDIQSNLRSEELKFDLGWGDGENDFVEGTYSLHGLVQVPTGPSPTPIHGDGKFTRSNQTQSPFNATFFCELQTNDEGHFEFSDHFMFYYMPYFTNFTLHDLTYEVNYPWTFVPIVEGWYFSNFGFSETPRTPALWIDYMSEVFAATPIADIVGDTFVSSKTITAKKLNKTPKYKKESVFDKEKNVWLQKISVSYEAN